MLRFFKKNPTSRLRAIRAYLLIVLITTLLLFAFSVVSLYEQRIRSQQLSSSNLRFNGEQIALDIERRMAVLAEDCLNAEVLKNLKYNSAQAQSLQTLKTYRKQLDALRKLHPIAEHFFIFDANGLVFPRITLPASQTPASMAPAPHTAPIKNYLELFSRGARAELIADKSVQAAGFYRNAAQLAVPNRLKALALFRTAQALNKSGQKSAALEIYRWLLRSYGDQYDQSQTPYVLSLSALPEEWTRPIFQSDSQSLYYVYRDLMDGKWELSAQQVESHLDRLERRLHLAADNRTASIFWITFIQPRL